MSEPTAEARRYWNDECAWYARAFPDQMRMDDPKGLSFEGFWCGWTKALEHFDQYRKAGTPWDQLELYQRIRPSPRGELPNSDRPPGFYIGYSSRLISEQLVPLVGPNGS